MKIQIIGSTCLDISKYVDDTKLEDLKELCQVKGILTIDDALVIAGQFAAICYLKMRLSDVLSEPREESIKRALGCIKRGHHSVFDHILFNLVIEDCPKIFAMLLNNEKVYATSEKSARYTKMVLTDREQLVYDKWLNIITESVLQVEPDFRSSDSGKEKAVKIAQENARYMTSVFTPTIMGHSITFRQINYLMHWFDDFLRINHDEPMLNDLKDSMRMFNHCLTGLYIPEFSDGKHRELSLFDKRENRKEEFGEYYSTNYLGSFAQLAQAQRHRTLNYHIKLMTDNPQFYVPPIIHEFGNDEEWQADLDSLKDLYPQGMLIQINEGGSYENLILKDQERLCSAAQFEVSVQTRRTNKKYLAAVEDSNPEVYDALKKCDSDARCGFAEDYCFDCTTPCKWFELHNQLDRLY